MPRIDRTPIPDEVFREVAEQIIAAERGQAGEWEWAVRLTRTGGGTWILPRDDEQHARLFFAEEGYEGAELIRRRVGPWVEAQP